MLEREVTVVNPLGLHARAAAQLVRLAGKFESSIEIMRPDKGVSSSARDILDLLYVAAGQGIKLKIAVDGDDELQAIEAVEDLFVRGFGEI